MMENGVTILLELDDEKYGNVKLALNKELKQICIINGKLEENPSIVYDIKLRNHLCRDKKYDHILD